MIANLVNQDVTSTGSGDILLGTAISSFTAMANVFANNDTVFYSVIDGNFRETGVGVYESAGNKIVRTKVFEIIDGSGYTQNPAGNLSLSTAATISCSPSIQALTTHLSTWKRLQSSLPFGANPYSFFPSFGVLAGAIEVPVFANSGNTEAISLAFAMEHDVKVGGDGYLAIHWAPLTSNTGVVRWGIEYVTGTVGDNLGTANTLYIEQAAGGTAQDYQLAELTTKLTLPGPNTISACRLFRDSSHANDTYTGDAAFLQASIAYQSDRIGTPKRNAPYDDWT